MRIVIAAIILAGGLLRLVAAAEPTWKVWYDDGSGLVIYHSVRNKWTDIPDRPGVQIVLVCYESPYRDHALGADWYWLEDGHPRESEGGLPNGQWIPRPRADARAGLTIRDETFERYRRAALGDKSCAP